MKCDKCRNEAEFGVDGEDTVLCADCYVRRLRDTLTLISNENFSGQSTLSSYAKRQADQVLALCKPTKVAIDEDLEECSKNDLLLKLAAAYHQISQLEEQLEGKPTCKTCGDSGTVPTFDQASQTADADPCPKCKEADG